MTAHDAVRLAAATVILTGLALAQLAHPAWLALPAFVGLNLLQFSFTGFCPALTLLRALGLRPETEPGTLAVFRGAQRAFGGALLLVVATAAFAPSPSLRLIAAGGAGLMALSFGQSALTRRCPALALARRGLA